MATEISKYHILFYGSPHGYQNNRAHISLYGPNGRTAAFLKFIEPGGPFAADFESAGIIRMHLPSDMLPSVLKVLRHEKTVSIYFARGRAFLSSSTAIVGEGE